MPLSKGSSPATVSGNIREMMAAGHPQDQAIAAALHMARETRPHRLAGGFSKDVDDENPGFQPTAFKNKIIPHVGPIHSPVAGRTDHLPMSVKSGSYVIPADIISAFGEGNTMAGFKIAHHIFESHPYFQGAQTPYGVSNSTPYGAGETPYGAKLATGGQADDDAPLVQIVAAGGEFVISPEGVTSLGEGDINYGHDVLDSFVKQYRAKTVDTLKKLPGPKRG